MSIGPPKSACSCTETVIPRTRPWSAKRLTISSSPSATSVTSPRCPMARESSDTSPLATCRRAHPQPQQSAHPAHPPIPKLCSRRLHQLLPHPFFTPLTYHFLPTDASFYSSSPPGEGTPPRSESCETAKDSALYEDRRPLPLCGNQLMWRSAARINSSAVASG